MTNDINNINSRSRRKNVLSCHLIRCQDQFFSTYPVTTTENPIAKYEFIFTYFASLVCWCFYQHLLHHPLVSLTPLSPREHYFHLIKHHQPSPTVAARENISPQVTLDGSQFSFHFCVLVHVRYIKWGGEGGGLVIRKKKNTVCSQLQFFFSLAFHLLLP